jgi:hypothetical protein
MQEAVLQQFSRFNRAQIGQLDGMLLRDRVREIRADADFLHVRHDQQRRVAESVGVLLQLRIGFDEVATRAFVFPDKAAVLPHIGVALGAANPAGRFLELVIGAAGLIDAKDFAKFEEVLLRGGALCAGVAAPLIDELLRRHFFRMTFKVERSPILPFPMGVRNPLTPTGRLSGPSKVGRTWLRRRHLKGLIIDEPWIGFILSGRKIWEMRSRNTRIRGRIGLIRKGSKMVVGVADLVDTVPDLSLAALRANFRKMGDTKPRRGADYKYRVAWVLKRARPLSKPVPYQHPYGAVIWVNLSPQVSAKVKRQISGTR